MKLLFSLMLSCVVSGAFADDVPAVAERLSCADISARMSEIAAISEPSEEDAAELTKLKADYRKTCVKSARGRRTSVGRVVIESESASDDAAPDKIEEEIVEIETEPVNEIEAPAESVAEVDPMIELEAELANLDAGLCADGSAPNKFGCCGDEVFKDLGDTVFACCPREGNGDCFPPLK